MKNTIEFKGPLNINHLDKDLKQKLENPGIYIWGFSCRADFKRWVGRLPSKRPCPSFRFLFPTERELF
jgi:hypothetical protein